MLLYPTWLSWLLKRSFSFFEMPGEQVLISILTSRKNGVKEFKDEYIAVGNKAFQYYVDVKSHHYFPHSKFHIFT